MLRWFPWWGCDWNPESYSNWMGMHLPFQNHCLFAQCSSVCIRFVFVHVAYTWQSTPSVPTWQNILLDKFIWFTQLFQCSPFFLVTIGWLVIFLGLDMREYNYSAPAIPGFLSRLKVWERFGSHQNMFAPTRTLLHTQHGTSTYLNKG